MQKLMISSVLMMTIASAAAAQGMKVDFDGQKSGVNIEAGSGRQGLASFLEAATAECGLVVPEVRKGVTPVNGPGCYGNCPDGEDPNGDDAYQDEIEEHRKDPPLAPPTPEELRPVIGAVCLNTGGGLDSDCYSENLRQSGSRLATKMLKRILLKELEESLTVKFPVATSYAVRVKQMEVLEVEMAKLVQAMLKDGLRQMQPFVWDTKFDAREKLEMIAVNEGVISRWEAAARDEAVGHRNWQEVRADIYRFRGGPAYQQLSDTLQGQRWFKTEVPR